jgi:transcriptional regulator with XRE-family HTH domain
VAPHPQQTAVKQLERAEKDRLIVELKRRGLSYPEIARQTGVPISTARDSVVRATREAQSLLFPEVALYVAEALDRLGGLLNAIWDRAMEGDDKAIGEARRIISDMGDYTGAKSPIRLEVGESDVDRQIRELTELLDERSRAVAGQADHPARVAGAGEATHRD